MVDCIAMSPLGGIYRSTRLGGQGTSPRDKEDYHGITSILNYHIWSCLIYSNTLLPIFFDTSRIPCASSSLDRAYGKCKVNSFNFKPFFFWEGLGSYLQQRS